MRFRTLQLVLPGIVLCLAARTVASAPGVADCNAPESVSVLHAAALTAGGEANAVWLSGRHLRWPGVESGGRFVLYHSARSQIHAARGEPVRGADGAVELQLLDASLPADVVERFKWVGQGAQLQVPGKVAARMRQLHRSQLVLVREDASGAVEDATAIQVAGALDDLFAAALDVPALGATPSAGSTRFALWAPTAQAVALCVYGDATSNAKSLQRLRRDDASGVWTSKLATRSAGAYYTYLVDVFVRGVGVVRNRVTDPYSLSLSTDSKRSFIADLNHASLKPANWDDAIRPERVAAITDMVIYELHVRDFSINDSSVPAEHRGKYLAFTQERSQGMRHLRALSQAGITDLHLLPVYDFASVPESGCVSPQITGASDSIAQQAIIETHKDADCFNWGYDPLHYTAPEGSYATDAADGATRIREFRAMVLALHSAGLRVGMDVVYNHTFASGQDPRSVLDRIVPGYYHRLDHAGKVERSTCCENTATENAMMARLMIDSAVVWARDYRIDSFRFDLMGHQPRAVMEQLQSRVNDASGRRIDLIGEGWNFGEVADGARFVQASQLSLNGGGIATFSDRARDAVRGGGAADNGIEQLRRQGYVNGLVHARNNFAAADTSVYDLMPVADMVRVGLAGSLRQYPLNDYTGRRVPMGQLRYGTNQPAGYVSQPLEVVNYVENHDNQTLFDLNVFKLPLSTSAADRARAQILGAAVVAFSQGIAYFHAGMELLRSKSMARNSFNSGDWFNRLDWTAQDNYFGSGLPPREDNQSSWQWMKPLLADPAIKPQATDIAWTRDAFFDLLRIRASSSLFRLRDAEQIFMRLHFMNTGPEQLPTILIGFLDGRGYPGAGFQQLLYFISVDMDTQVVGLPAARGKPFILHPVHRAAGAADRRPVEQATFDAASGRFVIPPRTALVYVIE